ncbi:MAG: hypothetical protein HAW67_03360 [Endozoicomonadaceae bacterium]|nr:hypothetical protein [Endozoicomonadaceae bacterium]
MTLLNASSRLERSIQAFEKSKSVYQYFTKRTAESFFDDFKQSVYLNNHNELKKLLTAYLESDFVSTTFYSFYDLCEELVSSCGVQNLLFEEIRTFFEINFSQKAVGIHRARLTIAIKTNDFDLLEQLFLYQKSISMVNGNYLNYLISEDIPKISWLLRFLSNHREIFGCYAMGLLFTEKLKCLTLDSEVKEWLNLCEHHNPQMLKHIDFNDLTINAISLMNNDLLKAFAPFCDIQLITEKISFASNWCADIVNFELYMLTMTQLFTSLDLQSLNVNVNNRARFFDGLLVHLVNNQSSSLAECLLQSTHYDGYKLVGAGLRALKGLNMKGNELLLDLVITLFIETPESKYQFA